MLEILNLNLSKNTGLDKPVKVTNAVTAMIIVVIEYI
jgi:hypothetical protein